MSNNDTSIRQSSLESSIYKACRGVTAKQLHIWINVYLCNYFYLTLNHSFCLSNSIGMESKQVQGLTAKWDEIVSSD